MECFDCCCRACGRPIHSPVRTAARLKRLWRPQQTAATLRSIFAAVNLVAPELGQFAARGGNSSPARSTCRVRYTTRLLESCSAKRPARFHSLRLAPTPTRAPPTRGRVPLRLLCATLAFPFDLRSGCKFGPRCKSRLLSASIWLESAPPSNGHSDASSRISDLERLANRGSIIRAPDVSMAVLYLLSDLHLSASVSISRSPSLACLSASASARSCRRRESSGSPIE